MIRAGLRRAVIVVAVVVAGTAAASLAVGSMTDTDPGRALSLGFYLVGAGLVVLALFSAGPVLATVSDDGESPSGRLGPGALAFLGVVLVLLGVLFDSQTEADREETPPQVVGSSLRPGR